MELLDYEREHLAALRSSLAECTVLLKRDGSFPLESAGELALFGCGARHTVKGGTGSGEVNSRFFVTAEEGLESAGFRLTTKAWMDAYDLVLQSAKKAFVDELKRRAKENHTNAIFEGMGAVMPEPEYEIPLRGAGDTAVYVLSRICGEGNDRRFTEGDLLLTRTEVRDILQLQRQYPRFLLVLNTGGPVDLSPVVSEVGNILLLSQLGAETGAVLADLILGKSCPSGKLTTTWAKAGDCPAVGDFGERDDTCYREGIYVGYRYYDSMGIAPLFPFGYGLSYTSFAVSEKTASLSGDQVELRAKVENTGSSAGKETLQLYVSKPESCLDHPFQELVTFSKTRELAPGDEEQLTLCFPVSELASYDSARACWVLEQGDYFLRLGTSSAETETVARLRLEQEVITVQTENACGDPGFADWKPALERIDLLAPDVPILTVDPESITRNQADFHWESPVEDAVRALEDGELVSMSLGAYNAKSLLPAVIGNAAFRVAGAAGETSAVTEKLGCRPLVMADGPAGLRLSRDYFLKDGVPQSVGLTIPETVQQMLPGVARGLLRKTAAKPERSEDLRHQYATAIPIGTAIAQSWNTDFAERCGEIVGAEMEIFDVDLWLAPALNIHRDVRCGRNFEYYSEDPVISGRFAAAITKGVQAHPGRGVTIKHFAANNQEYNRYNNNSRVSERAMREIYLRGFEICIREARPAALMTSYNLLNGEHTSAHTGLLHQILRCEFRYDGIVMTDWVVEGMTMKNTRYPGADAARVAAAGGDLFMPGSRKDAALIREALRKGNLSRAQLERNVSHLLRAIRRLKG